jgi:hypothetical protein
MEEIKDKIEEVAGNIKEYADIQYKLAVYKATDKTSSVGARIWSAYIIGLVFFLVVAFTGGAASFWLAHYTGSLASALLIVAGIYLVIAILLLVFKNQLLVNPIRNSIIKEVLGNGK